MTQRAVVVIGAGAAGIAAGRRLQEAGIEPLVLEARDRLGGRGWTVDLASSPFDLGCGWLHSAEENPWREIAIAQGRRIDRSVAPWERPAVTVGFPAERQTALGAAMGAFYERLETLAEAPGPDPSAEAALVPDGPMNPLIDAIHTYISGARLAAISLRDLDAYHDTHTNWRVADGYGTTIAAHAQGLDVRLGCPVTRIDHSGRRLRLETPAGVVEAERVIVTLPSTVIAEEPDLFHPALPMKVEAAAGLPLGVADKLFIALEDAQEFEPDTRAFGRTDRVETATYHLRPFGRPLIEAYFGGDFARALEAEGEAGFFAVAREELGDVFGSAFARRIRPLAASAWARDPHARGSYSFARPGQAAGRAVLAAPVDGRIFFAGEACSTHDFSTAHGAYRTGIAAADAAVEAARAAV
ncbi:flavin monoamine oxidase family protein [Mangrovibrevibacter kandeliae]|uniref:flavin monoamine oxidase family protein n=1 Tax=Mangrovibrevibacter kandeliae TaxID=2968473 RepID=UPI0021181B50|nr:NAD(P)/FAD-dependent oxidoreductase [Aurantimonas sp. CSK15Z-1]MCQ8784096.1 FAD-dependent oxidoreductase [Aurantimonas sp. CSK15Z-1]